MIDRDKTTMTLPSDVEIVFTREFDAPREIVWRALSDPDLIPRWWGPRRYETIVEKMDFRPGGTWRFLNRGADGTFGFSGEYKVIDPPKRIVQTMAFDGTPSEMGTNEVTLVERDGRTLLTDRSVFPSKESRDAIIATGMEEGARETYERLAEVVSELAARR